MPPVRALALLAALSLLAGCGGGSHPAHPARTSRYDCIVGINAKGQTASRAELERLRKTCAKLHASRPAALPSAVPGSLAAKGRSLVMSSGCEACHRIGNAGNPGPGPDLTGVRNRLPAAAITRAMINPVAPMPSFASLGAARLDAITAYLRSVPPG